MSELGQRLIAAVREIAAERPDHVCDIDAPYGCVYIDPDGNPSCIVGHAAHQLGLLIEEPHCGGDSSSITDIYCELGWDITRAEASWLGHVQREQDQRVRWSEAVRRADLLQGSIAA